MGHEKRQALPVLVQIGAAFSDIIQHEPQMKQRCLLAGSRGLIDAFIKSLKAPVV